MKILFNSLLVSFILLVFSNCNSQPAADKKTETITFKVWGNCEMCKETIETSLDVKGVKSAKWNVETKMIQVTFLPAKINPDQIHRNIAASGYDTEKVKGDDKAYSELPDCCHYERRK